MQGVLSWYHPRCVQWMPSFRVAEAWTDSGRCLTREDTLNVKQAAALLLTAQWLQEVMNQRWLGTPGMTPVLRLIVQGGPGTGNTPIVHMCKELTRISAGVDSTQQCVFMHSAARLVHGETLHGALSVPIKATDRNNKGPGKRKEELLHTWAGNIVCFLDEYAMASAELFGRAEFRAH